MFKVNRLLQGVQIYQQSIDFCQYFINTLSFLYWFFSISILLLWPLHFLLLGMVLYIFGFFPPLRFLCCCFVIKLELFVAKVSLFNLLNTATTNMFKEIFNFKKSLYTRPHFPQKKKNCWLQPPFFFFFFFFNKQTIILNICAITLFWCYFCLFVFCSNHCVLSEETRNPLLNVCISVMCLSLLLIHLKKKKKKLYYQYCCQYSMAVYQSANLFFFTHFPSVFAIYTYFLFLL